MKYRPEIDGLRAVAIVPVLLYHAGLGLHGGFVGVDVFLVISGYLITSLLISAIDGNQFSMFDFWERRIRRIFPPLAVVVLASIVAGWLLFLPRDLKMLAESVVAQSLLLSNVLFALQTGYFAESSQTIALLHTWSLAIEEQFYLLWPLLLFLVSRYARRHLKKIIISIGLLSFAINLYLTFVYPKAAFFLLPGRAWELLLGAYLAVVPRQSLCGRLWKEILSAAGLVMILCSIIFFGHKTPFPGAAALVPCFGTALLIWANGPSLSAVGRLLSVRPVVFLGWISYSLYLWHWPIFVIGKYYIENYILIKMSVVQRVGLLSLSLPLAVISWRYIETPIRRRLWFKSRAGVFRAALGMTIIFCITGLAVYLAEGVPSRFSQRVQETDNIRNELRMLPNIGLKDAVKGEFIEVGIKDVQKPISILLWGDSHASAMIPVIDSLCNERRVRGVAAVRYLTPPLLNRASQINTLADSFNSAVAGYIKVHEIKDVILAAQWNRYISDGYSSILESGLRLTVDHLRKAGVRIWIVKQVPAQHFDVPTALGCAFRAGRDSDLIGVPIRQHEENFKQQSIILGACQRAGVEVLDPAVLFLNEHGLYAAVVDDVPMYGDNNHLTKSGALALYPLFDQILK